MGRIRWRLVGKRLLMTPTPFLLHESYLTYFGELYRELRRVYEEANPPRVSLAKHSVVITLTLPEATDVPSTGAGAEGRETTRVSSSCSCGVRAPQRKCGLNCCHLVASCVSTLPELELGGNIPGVEMLPAQCVLSCPLLRHTKLVVFSQRNITVEHLLPASTGVSASSLPCITMILALYSR